MEPPSAAVSEYSYDCSVDDQARTFLNYRSAWGMGGQVETCKAALVKAAPLTVLEEQALQLAYAEVKPESLKYLYGVCANTVGYPHDLSMFPNLSPSEALEAAGALVLCPDHPGAADLKPRIDAAQSAIAQEAVDDQMRAEGKLIGPGNYLVGVDVPAGSWQSEGGDRVEDCYWEVSNANGDIIDNALISVVPQVTFTVPAEAAGLTISGCSYPAEGGQDRASTFRWVSP